MRPLLRAPIVAMIFLTRLPMPRVQVGDAEMTHATAFYPAAGGLIGALMAAVGLGALAAGLDPALAAVIAVAAEVWITSALHLDGIADAADGLGGGWTTERALEIMRDSRIGTYGGAAVVLTLMVRVTALSTTQPARWLAALVIAHALSRLAPVLLMRALPYVRAKDRGLASAQMASIGALHLLVAFGSALGLAWLLGGLAGLVACGVALCTTALAGLYFSQRLGGVTGDLLGASAVAAELAALCALSAWW